MWSYKLHYVDFVVQIHRHNFTYQCCHQGGEVCTNQLEDGYNCATYQHTKQQQTIKLYVDVENVKNHLQNQLDVTANVHLLCIIIIEAASNNIRA